MTSTSSNSENADRARTPAAVKPLEPDCDRAGTSAARDHHDRFDGAVARLKGPTDLGGYLDIVLDFAVYGAIPLGFILASPEANALAGAVLLVSFYVNGASFLAYAAVAARLGLETRARGTKSIYFTTGLAEGTETILFFVLFCLLPQWFAPLALVFAAMCFWTAFWLVMVARRQFR